MTCPIIENMAPYTIINTVAEDTPFVYHLFDEAIAYQIQNGYPVWRGYDKKVLEADRSEGRQFKIIINQEIACIFTVCFNDPLIWRERDQGDALYLHRIVVNPKYKGQQQFAKIKDWAIKFAREHNRSLLRMDTWADNPVLIEYYKNYGFQFVEYFTTPDTKELPIQHRGNKVILLEMQCPLSIKQLVSKFENKTLVKSDWTHEAHLKVATWYCTHYNYDTALNKLRNHIISYNEAVGTVNTTTGGYHETLTRFWTTVVGQFLKRQINKDLEESCQIFLDSDFSDKTYPLNFYQKDILFSKAARQQWILPDRAEFKEGY